MLYIAAFATVVAYIWYLGALEEMAYIRQQYSKILYHF